MENEIKETDEEKTLCLKREGEYIKNWLKEEEEECAIAMQQKEMEKETERKRQERNGVEGNRKACREKWRHSKTNIHMHRNGK